MNKQEIEKVINYMQNMDLSVFIDKDEACGVIDMVTKLLQQQLTNESEIKRLQDEVESLRNWNACEKEQYSDLLKSDKRRIELEEENEELRKQLTNGWIPVSERLPEIRQLYDVSLRYENFSGIYEITRMADYIGDGEWNIYGPQPVIATRHIMAWKNRTEPYKEVSHD